MTDKLEGGFFKLIKHCVIKILFVGLGESQFEGFNHQNAIFGLTFGKENNLITCEIEPAFGVSGFVSTREVKIISLESIEKDPKK